MRFREFEGEWKEITLEECTTNIVSGRTKPNIAGKFPVYGSMGIIGFCDIPTHKGKYLLIARVGANAGSINNVEGEFSVTDNTLILEIIEDFSIDYLYQKLLSYNLNKLIFGSGQPLITGGQLKCLNLFFPGITEQTKIAGLLQLIDERISTQSQIIESLETLIKDLIHSIIKGQEVNILLKDCLNCHSSTLMENAIIEKNGIYPVYGAIGTIAYTTDYKINEDSILIIKDGTSVGKVQYAKNKYSVIGTLNYLTPKENISLKYLYYYLQTFNFDKYIVGSGIPHIYFKNYGNEYIYCPDIEKQNEIANLLSLIDEKLEIEKQILKNIPNKKSIFLLICLYKHLI